jgi:hypothetical protein
MASLALLEHKSILLLPGVLAAAMSWLSLLSLLLPDCTLLPCPGIGGQPVELCHGTAVYCVAAN